MVVVVWCIIIIIVLFIFLKFEACPHHSNTFSHSHDVGVRKVCFVMVWWYGGMVPYNYGMVVWYHTILQMNERGGMHANPP